MAVLRRLGAHLKRLIANETSVTGRELQFRSETLLIHSHAVGSRFAAERTLPDALSQCAAAVLAKNDKHPTFEQQITVVKNYLLGSTYKTLRSVSDFQDEQLKEKHGFIPVVRKSNIPEAGEGLFIDGQAKAGTIVALYPGVCYLPSDLYRIPNFHKFIENNEYLMWRYDGVVIDGQVAIEIETDVPEATDVQQDLNKTVNNDAGTPPVELVMHPFSNGHRANHAPQGQTPNCLQYHLNIPITRCNASLRPYIPNTFYPASRRTILDGIINTTFRQKVSSTSKFGEITGAPNLVPTLAFLATRDIQDEEVFINYRYNPNGPQCPSWYHDCDPQSTARRWADGDKIFFRS